MHWAQSPKQSIIYVVLETKAELTQLQDRARYHLHTPVSQQKIFNKINFTYSSSALTMVSNNINIYQFN